MRASTSAQAAFTLRAMEHGVNVESFRLNRKVHAIRKARREHTLQSITRAHDWKQAAVFLRTPKGAYDLVGQFGAQAPLLLLIPGRPRTNVLHRRGTHDH